MALPVETEISYRYRAKAVFGPFIQHSCDRADDIADLLHNAFTAGQVSSQDFGDILATTILWGGKSRFSEVDIIAVLTVVLHAEINSVERTHRYAMILRRLGLQAVAVVASKEWNAQVLSYAQALAVVVASNGQIDNDSWHVALTSLAQ